MDVAWRRDTRVCASIDLQAELLAAIRDHLQLHEIEVAEAKALVCCETTSVRIDRPGLLERMAGGGNRTLTQAVIVTPTRLVWAQPSERDEAFARSELLAGLEVTDYAKGAGFALIPDHGVEVRGVHADQGRLGTLFFGLGEGPDADHARHS